MIDYNKILLALNNIPYTKEFIDKYQISDEYIKNHLSCFIDCVESLNICKNCKGLESCKQAKKGEMITLNFDEAPYNDVTYCKLYLKKKAEDKRIGNFVYSDIPGEYKDLNLSNIEILDDNIKDLLMRAIGILDGKRKKGLYIYGDLGIGKTYMCIALANSLAASGKKVAFIKSNFFINRMRQLISTDTSLYEKIIKDIKECQCLIIDDIGSETVSAYSRDDLLFNILDYRMEHKLLTIFTSNLSKSSLLEHYTYDKDNCSNMRAKRLLERVDILSDDFVLNGQNKRRTL